MKPFYKLHNKNILLCGIFFALAGLLLSVKFFLNVNQKTYQPNVLVIINGEALTTSEVNKVIKNYRIAGSQAANRLDQILSDLIDEKLILQEAKRRKIDATREEIEARLKQLKNHLPSLYQQIYTQMSEKEYKEILKNRIIIQKLYTEVISSQKNKPTGEHEPLETSQKEKEIFAKWVKELREKADITFLQENIQNFKESLRKETPGVVY
ncbi:SurA N-terminal domain-containing protein [Carboxydothermus hydrogenoformans]|uniref:peptidylprolyl isomerase n=1 Tax=Carboxydothermus hydrogenoformans (strain ATCC BAA-161 / DSM 6008 / Z-2901) TaxID=246194 RepID=Q3ADZ9_CARHZ|nr:SurA N-terminal domain-containing protein [Carboxydothermus hydrogenoformans]ABB14468.1 hypothetical protein CHY_0781 [Carboxydothermus hydrogenoformans Z-2901]